MKKTIYLVFLFCTSLFAQEINTNQQIKLLNVSQKKILYEFAFLSKNGLNTDKYWQKNKNKFDNIDAAKRNRLAAEIYAHCDIIYTPVKNSTIQLWMQTQSLTNWMLYLSAFIAICGMIGLLRNFRIALINFLAPFFRLLFSAILLTYELLVIGIICTVGGCLINDITLRTIIIHIGFFLLWSQSTAIFTGRYLIQKYIFEIKNNFWENNCWEGLKTITLPAIVVTSAILYVFYKVSDTIYNFEIVISVMAAICTLPYWHVMEKYMRPILIPFKDIKIERSVASLAAYVVLALIFDSIFILLYNPIFSFIITALTGLLIISFLLLSCKGNFRNNYKNYYYLQLAAIIFLTFVLVYSFKIHSEEMIWVSLIGTSVFLVIKYWEIPTFFLKWKRSNTWTWGFLGQSVLLWVLAKAILYISRLYIA